MEQSKPLKRTAVKSKLNSWLAAATRALVGGAFLFSSLSELQSVSVRYQDTFINTHRLLDWLVPLAMVSLALGWLAARAFWWAKANGRNLLGVFILSIWVSAVFGPALVLLTTNNVVSLTGDLSLIFMSFSGLGFIVRFSLCSRAEQLQQMWHR